MKRSPLLLLLLFLFSGRPAMAQQGEFCSNLQNVVHASEIGIFDTLYARAARKGTKGTVSSSMTISGRESYLFYHPEMKKTVYSELIVVQKDTTDPKAPFRLLENTAAQLRSCLKDSGWVFTKDEVHDQPVYIYKNLKNRVFLKFAIVKEGIQMLVFRQMSSSAYCRRGNCTEGYGQYVYESGDTYEGDFHKGQPFGLGTYHWNALGMEYSGSWLNGNKTGYGIYFNRKGTENKRTYLLDEKFIDIDTNKIEQCQAGNCNSGEGAIMYRKGEVYTGQFKNRLPDGLGMLETKIGTYYGEFKKGQFDGFGILYLGDDRSYRGNFRNGEKEGASVEITKEKNTIVGTTSGNTTNGAEYSPLGVLVRKGIWKNGKFSSDTASSTKELTAFAHSLQEILNYQEENYASLTDGQLQGFKMPVYQSKKSVRGSVRTVITVGTANHRFVQAVMNKETLSHKSALHYYNTLISLLRASLSEDWKSTEEKNADTPTQVNRTYAFMSNTAENLRIEIDVDKNNIALTFF